MGISANDLSAPTGESFKFTNIGDTVEGVIVYAGDFQKQTSDYGKEREVARIGIDVGGGEIRYVWPERGKSMAQALSEAARKSTNGIVDVGQRIKLGYTSNKDTGKPQPMKVFSCRLEPGSPADALDDEEPF
jgi:hypothetical protein